MPSSKRPAAIGETQGTAARADDGPHGRSAPADASALLRLQTQNRALQQMLDSAQAENHAYRDLLSHCDLDTLPTRDDILRRIVHRQVLPTGSEGDWPHQYAPPPKKRLKKAELESAPSVQEVQLEPLVISRKVAILSGSFFLAERSQRDEEGEGRSDKESDEGSDSPSVCSNEDLDEGADGDGGEEGGEDGDERDEEDDNEEQSVSSSDEQASDTGTGEDDDGKEKDSATQPSIVHRLPRTHVELHWQQKNVLTKIPARVIDPFGLRLKVEIIDEKGQTWDAEQYPGKSNIVTGERDAPFLYWVEPAYGPEEDTFLMPPNELQWTIKFNWPHNGAIWRIRIRPRDDELAKAYPNLTWETVPFKGVVRAQNVYNLNLAEEDRPYYHGSK